MDNEGNCGCEHHGEHFEESHESHEEDCGCGGHGYHGMGSQWHHHCRCGCHQHHGDMRFHRRFISREEILSNLEEYLKQLLSEAKGVEERITEMKKMGESQT